MESRLWQGIPSIECSFGGRLWDVWFSGGPKEPNVTNYVALPFSDGDGKTWNEPFLVVDYPDSDTRVFDPNLWIDPDGRLWVTWSQNTTQQDTTEFGTDYIWTSICDDPDAEDTAFSESRFMSSGIKLNKITVLSNGEWIYPTWEYSDWPVNHVFLSTDKGETWVEKGGTIKRYG